jgi:hypothetical protein
MLAFRRRIRGPEAPTDHRDFPTMLIATPCTVLGEPATVDALATLAGDVSDTDVAAEFARRFAPYDDKRPGDEPGLCALPTGRVV